MFQLTKEQLKAPDYDECFLHHASSASFPSFFFFFHGETLLFVTVKDLGPMQFLALYNCM
jgi:hypothetical protein